jgi:hypothetical protein
MIRRKEKYVDIEIPDIAGLLFWVWFFLGDQPLSSEMQDQTEEAGEEKWVSVAERSPRKGRFR